MNLLRVWLRRWLGIEEYEGGIELLRERMDQIQQQPTFADLSRKQLEIDNALREVKELKEAVTKRAPVVTRSMREYKALMEQD